jgi:hypothetical protein
MTLVYGSRADGIWARFGTCESVWVLIDQLMFAARQLAVSGSAVSRLTHQPLRFGASGLEQELSTGDSGQMGVFAGPGRGPQQAY